MSVTGSDYVVLADLKKKGLAVKGYNGAYWLNERNARGREFSFEDEFDEDMQDVIREPNGWEVIYAWAWSTLLDHGFKIVSEEKTTAWAKWEFVRDAAA
ncbi:hypothetical protein AAVH_18137 [Aphelenchoides avenae]|nr:hypothetical protein AAVH_18137 [Aphelenchus avenae]